MNNDPPQVERSAKAAALLAAIIVATSGLVASATSPTPVAEFLRNSDASFGETRLHARIAFWPFTAPRPPAIYDSLPNTVTPHPAVARIIVPEHGATAFGSGTLIDVREDFGLVVTNWHVVRDAQGVVEVVFPSGFRSLARPLKVDSNWDLAALVIWRPPVEPVKVAAHPPQPGDLLTIHGYGRGKYRIATGRCTGYYAPKLNFPMEMVELDVEARLGDSGGPIFNQRGELAGVLFGAGEGTTLGSYAPRVSNFLATLAPDIGQAKDQAQVAVADRPAPNVAPRSNNDTIGSLATYPSAPWSPDEADQGRSGKTAGGLAKSVTTAATPPAANTDPRSTFPLPPSAGWYDYIKSALAVLGIAVIALRLVKAVG